MSLTPLVMHHSATSKLQKRQNATNKSTSCGDHTEHCLARLTQQLSEAVEERGFTEDSALSSDLSQIMEHNAKSMRMFDPMWEAIFRLENLGFRVLAVCCDGLAANRRLFSLHQPGSTTPVYKVPNPHAHDGERHSL